MAKNKKNTFPAPPVAPRKDTGVGDPYAWLRADNWQEVLRDPSVLDPDIRAYLEAENAYTDAAMAPLEARRKSLVREMRARIKEDDASVPVPVDGFRYYVRYREGGEHPLYCRTSGDDGAEEILLDADAEAKGAAFYRIAAWSVSADHARFAYGVDLSQAAKTSRSGSAIAPPARWSTTPSPVPAATCISPTTAPRSFMCAATTTTARAGSTATASAPLPIKTSLIYEEPDAGFFVSLDRTESHRYITINCTAHDNTTEVRLIDADAPDAAGLVAPRDTGVSYSVYHRADQLVIVTNADGAEDFKVVTCPAATSGDATTGATSSPIGPAA